MGYERREPLLAILAHPGSLHKGVLQSQVIGGVTVGVGIGRTNPHPDPLPEEEGEKRKCPQPRCLAAYREREKGEKG